MGYTLRAVVARCGVLGEAPPWTADSSVLALAEGFCMIPLTQGVCYAFGPADRPWLYTTHSIFTHLPEALVPRLLELSRGGRVAYVEAEYHGGEGEQRSVVWEGGAAVRAPEESAGAINSALHSLGVTQAPGMDPFDTLGLGRHRSVDDWLEAARPAAAPAAAQPVAEPAPARAPWWRFWR